MVHEAVFEFILVVDEIIIIGTPKAHVHENTTMPTLEVDFSLLESLAKAVRVLSGDPLLEILFLVLCEWTCCLNGDASVEFAVSTLEAPFGRT